MKLHPRTLRVNEAMNKLEAAFIIISEQYGLTAAEHAHVAIQVAARCTKWAIRAERHGGDTSKKADEA